MITKRGEHTDDSQISALCLEVAPPSAHTNYQPLNHTIESRQMRNTNPNRTMLANKIASEYNMKGLKAFESFFVNSLKASYKQDKKSFKEDAQVYMQK